MLSFFYFSRATFANKVDGGGTIRGNVTTGDDQPAATVTVSIKNSKRNFLTAEDGSFVFNY